MKRILLQLLFLITTFGFAQVGVNTTTPDPSSMLDVSATNKGALFPRVSLSNINLTTLDGTNTAATGLLIWNTNLATIGGNGVGYYYFNGTIWVPITQIASNDHDWYEIGGTTAANSINDNIYTLGGVAIGKNTLSSSTRLDIFAGLSTNTGINIFVSATNSGSKIGINNIVMNSNNENITGLRNTLSGTTDLKYGIFNSFSDLADPPVFGTGDNIGTYNLFTSYGSVNQIGLLNSFSPSSSISGDAVGIQNRCDPNSFFNSSIVGMTNLLNNNNCLIQKGTINDFSGTASGIKTGLENTFSGTGNSTFYGLSNTITNTGSGNKYGIFTSIASTAGGTQYGMYSDVLKAGSFAGYFLGNVSIGTTALNNYILPPSRGTNGQVMQTDGSGNVSWVTPLANIDHDWYEEGTTAPPDAITDDIFHTGNMAIGKITADTPIDVVSSGTFSSNIKNTITATANGTGKTGIENNMSGLVTDAFTAVKNSIATEGDGNKFGIHNIFDSKGNIKGLFNDFRFTPNHIGSLIWEITGVENQFPTTQSLQKMIGMRTTINSTSANFNEKYGIINTVDNAIGGGDIFGINNTLTGSSTIGYKTYGIKNNISTRSNSTSGYGVGTENNFSPSGINSLNIGTRNSFSGSGSYNYGTQNYFGGTGTVEEFGTYNSFGSSLGVKYGLYNLFSASATGTGDKYGVYTFANTAAGGTHYGIYSDVLKTGSYAGYFLGNVSIGTTTSNNYILPPSRGTNGQIMQTDALGNVTWVNPPTDTDDQGTDVFSFTGTTLNLSLQNDGVATQTVDLSSLRDADWFEEGTSTPADAITDDIYHSGNVAIGQNTATTPLDIASNGVLDINIKNTLTANTAGTEKTALKNSVTGSTNTTITATHNSITATGSGLKYGTYNSVNNQNGTNDAFGVYNTVRGSNTSGKTVGTYNDINGFVGTISNTLVGTQNVIAPSANGTSMSGTLNRFIGAGGTSSVAYGVQNDFNNTSSTVEYGVYNIFGPSNLPKYGLYSTFNTASTGDKYGVYNTINSTAGGQHYGIYSDVLKTGSYAGYFLGNVSIGTTTTNNYILPPSRGTNGQTMQTDGSGNVSWVNPTVDTDDQTTDVFSLTGTTLNLSLQNDGVPTQTVDLSSLRDNDWFEVGGTSQPDAITDNKYTFGDISIGKSTAASAKLDVDAVTKTTTLSLSNSNATAGTKWGILNNLNVDTTNPNSAGIANNVSGNANFKYGIYNYLQGATTGANFEYGMVNNHNSSGNVSGFGLFNSFSPTATNTGNYTGLYNEDINANHTGGFVGVNNSSGIATSSTVFGISNNIGGSGSGIRAGVYNNMGGTSSGDVIGTETYMMVPGTGNKYGERITILNTTPGTHYGIYSDVTKANSYAGYFLGNVSVGTNITNNYILPPSRGTNGQIMRTDGSGNVSWVTPTVVTDTDDQIIDVLSLTGDTLNISLQDDAVATQTLNLGTIDNQGTDVFSLTGNTLNLSLQNDGVATQTVDLSSLSNDWKLTGNAGTTSGTNFIGTTDAQDLDFRTNNIIKARLTQQGQLTFQNTGGSIFIGNNAGNSDDLTTNQNTFVGGNAGQATTTGNVNTALGIGSLSANIDGFGNTAIGTNSLNTNTSGDNNTALGRGSDVATNNLTNASAIGYNTTVNASNKIRLGDTTITVIEGQVAYTNPSDARFKFNVQENVPGLDFIKKLKPVTYNFDTKKFDEHLNKNRNKNEVAAEDFTKSTAIIRTGFLAQDVEKICADLGYNFDGLHIPDANNPTDNYGIAYSQFIMPIVKAVQEQQVIIETQKTELEQLKSELEKYKQLENRIKALEQK
jgi:hypothetical protein